MVDILLDTSFVMELSSRPLIGFEEVESKYGKIRFVVMDVVIEEIRKIASRRAEKRARKARMALDFVTKQRLLSYPNGESVDDKLFNYASEHLTPIATLDRQMMKRLRNSHLPLLTLSKNRIQVEGVISRAKPS